MKNLELIFLKSEIEPMWQTLLFVGFFVIAFFVWILPRELRKREEQDEKYEYQIKLQQRLEGIFRYNWRLN